MKYLFGDSVPFPLGYNFLATLDAFVGSATRAVQINGEIQQLQAAALAGAASRTRSMAELETFHRGMIRTIHEFTSRTNEPQTGEYARQIEEYATGLVEQAKASATQASEREQLNARGEIERRRHDARAALEGFLLGARLPASEAKISMRLADGRNELSAVLVNPNGIMTAFTLAGTQRPEWAAPRRIGELVQGLALPVGTRRSWIKRTHVPELVQLDEFFLGGFELMNDAAEIRLRRKPEQRDVLVFRLQRTEEGMVHAEAHRLEDEPEATSGTLDAADAQQVERLWQALLATADATLDAKQQLVSVSLDGEDVLERDLIQPFLERVVQFMAPIVVEIDRRSPNKLELSLKLEDESGRREELYLRKEGLVSKLNALGTQERAIFAPLGLTHRPDDDSLTEVSVEEA
jgi:hypothetical protein